MPQEVLLGTRIGHKDGTDGITANVVSYAAAIP
jgi:hypothetical protein